MRLDPIDANRLERAIADVERDLDDLDAACGERREQRRTHVQPRRGRRHGAALAGEHGLIPAPIVEAIRPFDVRRQRHVADRIHRRLDRRSILRPEAYHPPPLKAARQDLAV